MPTESRAVQQVVLRGIFKDYGEKRALSDVSLTLEAGQVTALLGENGAGKSTLLGVLALQIRPTRGTLLFDGQDVSELDGVWLRQSLSLLSHEPRCYAGCRLRHLNRRWAVPSSDLRSGDLSSVVWPLGGAGSPRGGICGHLS